MLKTKGRFSRIVIAVNLLKTFTAEEHKTAALFLAPLFLLIGGFVLLPILGTIGSGFFQDVAFLEKKFIGVSNYVSLLEDPGFWQALRFTLAFIAASVPLEIFLGLVFALILNENIPFRGILRVSILIPWAVPNAVSARIWELIYNYQYGLANFLLLKLGIASHGAHWLGTSFSAFSSLVIADAWKTSPFVALILLAGLQTIPDELYDQAKIDRAGIVQRFLYLTLPLLKPALMVSLLFRTIDSLRIFDLIYVLTGGGPGGATNSVSLYAYKYFLLSDFGYGSAVSVVLFTTAFILSCFYLKVGKFRESIT